MTALAFPSSLNLRLDFIKALPDIEERINKWQELTVNKSVKAAESGFVKALKKKGGVLTSPEALEQLNKVTTEASTKALAHFDQYQKQTLPEQSLWRPLC